MIRTATFRVTAALATSLALTATALAGEICAGYGPQAPRDIASLVGTNPRVFAAAPAPEAMNLCNIHTHANAEHKGPGFSIGVGSGEHGGFRCNEADSLTPAEREEPAHAEGGFHGVEPGDTIEVHWVYSSCDVAPGEGLGACMSETCTDPQLRVESQVFLLVNDARALNFNDFTEGARPGDGRSQPKALPGGTGTPVVFAGSTTGPTYTESACSPLQVTWSVRPDCARLDIASLHAWAEKGNVFKEAHAHGVRPLVTSPELLAPIR